jgi:hypothetical protein
MDRAIELGGGGGEKEKTAIRNVDQHTCDGIVRDSNSETAICLMLADIN